MILSGDFRFTLKIIICIYLVQRQSTKNFGPVCQLGNMSIIIIDDYRSGPPLNLSKKLAWVYSQVS